MATDINMRMRISMSSAKLKGDYLSPIYQIEGLYKATFSK